MSRITVGFPEASILRTIEIVYLLPLSKRNWLHYMILRGFSSKLEYKYKDEGYEFGFVGND